MSLLTNWLESLHEEIKISTKCSRERTRKSTCSYCLEQCVHEAIILKDHLLVIHTNQCTMCGECMIACPLSAIEGVAATRNFENGHLLFDDNYTPSIKELLIYKKRGISSIQVNTAPLNQEWETVLDLVNERLIILGEASIKVVNKDHDEKLSRRALLSSFQKEGRQLVKSMAPASWKIDIGGWKLTKYYSNYQFFSVEMNKNKCTLCKACISLCTEDVFTLKESLLEINNEKCVNCTACADVCPVDAIQIHSEVKRRSEGVDTFHTKKCIGCGQTFNTFQTETEKCHICINRDPEWLSPY